MEKNIGILVAKNDIIQIDNLPNNIYFYYLIKNVSDHEIILGLNFLTFNNCKKIIASKKITNLISSKINLYKNIEFIELENIKSYSNIKRIISYNISQKKLKDSYDYEKINKLRKDSKPKDTIKKIKKILKSNNYKVKEIGIKKSIKGSYSIRLELKSGNGSNGKGISLTLARASAYAELMERLQSNMLNKVRISTPHINRNNKLYETLLFNASEEYKKQFFQLDNIYFNIEKVLNLKKGIYEEVPINAINCFCHTNGLASGNSFEEAVNQAIFEILERYCYQFLLKNNIKVNNINIDDYPLNKKNKTILKQLENKGYKYYIKDCSLGKYPVLGFLLFNNDKTKYSFTIGSDFSFDIALSRCITEMLQGVNLKELNKKMVEKIPFDVLKTKYSNNFESYNWLRCFNNNNGYLTENFFCNGFQKTDNLKFKNYFINNKEVLEELKKTIDNDIYIKDYSTLGFCTYRVYIPYMTAVDCYDIDDLLINKHYDKLKKIYLNILNCNNDDLDFFIDIFLNISKNIKYDEMIKPTDLFHIVNNADYYKLDFTSLLIILTALRNRLNDILHLLQFKIENFQLTSAKEKIYKIIINVIKKEKLYDINDFNIENQIKQIFDNPRFTLESLKPNTSSIKEDILTNKKSL